LHSAPKALPCGAPFARAWRAFELSGSGAESNSGDDAIILASGVHPCFSDGQDAHALLLRNAADFSAARCAIRHRPLAKVKLSAAAAAKT
jgi:hypothetical protein